MTVNQARGLAMSVEMDHLSAQAAFRISDVTALQWSASPGPNPRNQANPASLETPFDLRIPCSFPAVLNLTPDQLAGPATTRRPATYLTRRLCQLRCWTNYKKRPVLVPLWRHFRT